MAQGMDEKALKRQKYGIPTYSLAEELLNSISHGIGAGLGIAALVLCIVKSAHAGDGYKLASSIVFGLTTTLLYLMSCLYHALKVNRAKKVFRVFDHCTIFLLIAGTYTPYTLVTLRGPAGWVMFGIVWAVAITGVVLNAVNLKKFAKNQRRLLCGAGLGDSAGYQNAGGEPRLPWLGAARGGRRGVHRRRGAVRHRLEEEVFSLHFPFLLSDWHGAALLLHLLLRPVKERTMHQEILFPREKAELYPLLAQQIAALAEDSQPLSTLANASALLYEALPDINWAGFYLASGDMLHLGPFQGRTACTQIPFGRGVCGTAAATRQVQVVPDVQRFPGHIACDSASRSEIVLPIWVDGQVFGVLDIDSPSLNRFTEQDADGLTAFVAALTRSVDFAHGLLK